MQFDAPLIPATLVRREKRFLAHCLLEDGRAIVAHCPNTGSMLGCAAPGSRVWLSESDRPAASTGTPGNRGSGRCGRGIHTGRSNALVAEALGAGHLGARRAIRFCAGKCVRRRGQPHRSVAGGGARPACYVEVKNVTAAVADRIACFPDARTEPAKSTCANWRAWWPRATAPRWCFAVQRIDADAVRPPTRSIRLRAALRLAAAQGV